MVILCPLLKTDTGSITRCGFDLQAKTHDSRIFELYEFGFMNRPDDAPHTAKSPPRLIR